ncbi:hypothetical protein Tco_1218490 [Tanacetum coccineum]
MIRTQIEAQNPENIVMEDVEYDPKGIYPRKELNHVPIGPLCLHTRSWMALAMEIIDPVIMLRIPQCRDILSTWFRKDVQDGKRNLFWWPNMKVTFDTLCYHASMWKAAPYEARMSKCRIHPACLGRGWEAQLTESGINQEETNRKDRPGIKQRIQADRIDKRVRRFGRKADGVRIGDRVMLRSHTLARVELPQEFERIHHTFPCIKSKDCLREKPLVCRLEGNFHVDDKLQFVEEPVEIMEREIKRLKRSRIPLVKVRWNSRRGPEFTWEREDSFNKNTTNSSQTGLWALSSTKGLKLEAKLF